MQRSRLSIRDEVFARSERESEKYDIPIGKDSLVASVLKKRPYMHFFSGGATT